VTDKHPPLTLRNIVHQIDHLLFSVDVKPEDRHFVLYVVRQGFDENTGEYRERTVDLECALWCRGCEHREYQTCPEDCEVLRLRQNE